MNWKEPKVYAVRHEDEAIRAASRHAILRPSCYECPYKSAMHPGDITIADYRGIEKAAPEFDDNKGVPLVLVNNATGKKVLTFLANYNGMCYYSIKADLFYCRRTYRMLISAEPPSFFYKLRLLFPAFISVFLISVKAGIFYSCVPAVRREAYE